MAQGNGAGAAGGAAPRVARTVADLRAAVAGWRADGLRVALVPTMGFLHDGHMALIESARALADRVVVSIFVNPTQFGPKEDFAHYPRDEAGDMAKLARAGVEVVFTPTVGDMYPDGFSTRVSVGALGDALCGPFRPGHFDGVATVCAKLLLQALPDHAMFGEKDFQQLLIIRRMARDLDIPVAIEGVATIREADGLALSSRNAYLSADQRKAAPALHAAIADAAARIAAGDAPVAACADARVRMAAAGFEPIDYVEARAVDGLRPLDVPGAPGVRARVFAAAWLGGTRLIDNVPVR